MRSTDYLVGIHGAGLSLSIFFFFLSILHEITHKPKNHLLTTMKKILSLIIAILSVLSIQAQKKSLADYPEVQLGK